MAAHQYSALQDRQIRLVKIRDLKQPGRLEIHTVSLDDAPKYRATSYVWGGTPREHKILLSGGRYALVTVSLLKALPYMTRHPKEDFIWCDQICINQEDNVEKSIQVPMMADIYRRAAGVFIWLGEETQHTPGLKRVLEFVVPDSGDFRWPEPYSIVGIMSTPSERLAVDRTLKWIRLEAAKHDLVNHPNPDYEPSKTALQVVYRGLNQSLCSVFNAIWFTRIWTVQEALLPSEARFYLGDIPLSPCQLRDFAAAVVHHGTDEYQPTFKEDTIGYHTFHFYDTFFKVEIERSLFTNLKTLRTFMEGRLRATDPRDMIYGILGITSGEAARHIEVDYTNSWQICFATTTKAIIASRENLDVLLDCCDGIDANTATSTDLPSWVPDWRVTHVRSVPR